MLHHWNLLPQKHNGKDPTGHSLKKSSVSSVLAKAIRLYGVGEDPGNEVDV